MTFFEFVINNTLAKKTHTIFFVFGRSGTGKTYSTIALAHFLNNLYRKKLGLKELSIEEFINNNYFISHYLFDKFLTNVLERKVIIEDLVFVYDEIREFIDNYQYNIYNIFNRMRIFQKYKSLISFIIGHSHADIQEIKLRRIIRYFIKFYSLGACKVYEMYEKPKGYRYLLNYRRAVFLDNDGLKTIIERVYIDLSEDTIKRIRDVLEPLEVITKEEIIKSEIEKMRFEKEIENLPNLLK